MDTVTNQEVAICMAQNGGIGIIHRSMSIDDQSQIVQNIKSTKGQNIGSTIDSNANLCVGAAVGAGEDFESRVAALVAAGVDLFVIDTAQGHVKFIIDCIRFIKNLNLNIPIMAGNITTFEAGIDLLEAGADILRVGMGPGSICTTRIVTGVGVPQLTAIEQVKNAILEFEQTTGQRKTLIADGGIKQIGDIAKAIAFGADAVMLGSLLAGFDQSPGQIIENNGKKFKIYRGMGSASAMSEGSAARYGQAGIAKDKLVSEGVEGLVKYKGDLENFLFQIIGGLKSSFYYVGSKNINDFQTNSRFVQISPASFAESMPHNITLTDGGSSFIQK
jgi:IMP dehydrogenase